MTFFSKPFISNVNSGNLIQIKSPQGVMTQRSAQFMVAGIDPP
jgi:hypothetical protein